MATSSLMRLTAMSAAMNSAGRSGLIMRWARVRDEIASRRCTEKPRRLAVSWRPLDIFRAAASNGEEHFLQIGPAEALDQLARRVVGDDAALLQHDHSIGKALHLRHVV